MTLDVVWTGTGPISTIRANGTFDCLTYSTQTQNVNVTNPANVTATVTGPLFTNTNSQGSLVSGDARIHAQGVDQPPCIFRT